MPPRWPAFLAAPLAIAVPAAHATTYLTVAQAQQALFPGASFTPLDLKRREHVWRASSGGWFLLDEVLGKHELITYAIALDAHIPAVIGDDFASEKAVILGVKTSGLESIPSHRPISREFRAITSP